MFEELTRKSHLRQYKQIQVLWICLIQDSISKVDVILDITNERREL